MKNFDYDNFSEGDWEDRGDIAWNEFDWERFLKRQDNESARFIRVYNSLAGRPNRIDEAAQILGWDSTDWSMNDFSPEGDFTDADSIDLGNPPEEEPEADIDPYTIHRHPLYIASQGLFDSIVYTWEALLKSEEIELSTLSCFDLMQSLSQGKMKALLALQALDLADYALTISELKRALRTLNSGFSVLESLDQHPSPKVTFFVKEAKQRLFDIREIWLRVMYDCRVELDRRISEDD